MRGSQSILRKEEDGGVVASSVTGMKKRAKLGKSQGVGGSAGAGPAA